MEHGFTHEEWLDFLDGALPAAERGRLESHLDDCPVAGKLHRQSRRRRWQFKERPGY